MTATLQADCYNRIVNKLYQFDFKDNDIVQF